MSPREHQLGVTWSCLSELVIAGGIWRQQRGNMVAQAGGYGNNPRGNIAAAAGIMCSDDQADRAIEILEGLRGQGGVERHLGDIYSEQGDYKR